MESRAIIVEKGTAPEDFLPQIKKFIRKLVENRMNG